MPKRPGQTVQTQLEVIKVFPVCYSVKHFVNSSPDNQIFFYLRIGESVKILENVPYHANATIRSWVTIQNFPNLRFLKIQTLKLALCLQNNHVQI